MVGASLGIAGCLPVVGVQFDGTSGGAFPVTFALGGSGGCRCCRCLLKCSRSMTGRPPDSLHHLLASSVRIRLFTVIRPPRQKINEALVLQGEGPKDCGAEEK